jgi:ribonuclease P protein component
MLPTKNKLHLNRDFDKIFKTGHSLYGQFFGIKIINNNLNNNRFGILISSKIYKKAVDRNLIKRQIKGFLIRNKDSLEKGFDCVIIVLLRAKNIKNLELIKDLNNLFEKLNLKKK